MLVRAPYTLPLLFVVCCWFRHNAAIPLASHSSSQIQNAFKDKKANSQDNWDSTQSDSSKETETSEENNDEIQNAIKNQNVNVNMNIFDRKDRHRFTRNRNEHHKPNITENILLVTGKETLEQIAKEKESTNCASNKKKNQRYSSSFIGNSTSHSINVDKEFDEVVGNNSKVKRTSSVHEGEDITLCWIELTTIKEDKIVRPPKKLVIREYIISFENSATIPEKYLECKKFEGELTANDPEIGQTALFEVIDEDTMVSRIVNFTSVSHVGNVVVWEHKSVKCGVGPVVSKNIVELSDGSKNPKKRVEIKVSPKMHQLTATKAKEETEEPCTDDYEEEGSEESSTIKSTTEYTAEITTGFAGILPEHDREISSSEETVEQSKIESESEENLSGITKLLETLPDEEIFERTTIFPKIPTTIQEFSEKIDCEENSSDPVCLMQKSASSSEELFPESSSTSEAIVTEVVTETSPITLVDTKMSVPISSREIIAEKEISSEERSEKVTESLSTSKEEEEIVSKLAEKTTPVVFTTGISEESSKVSQSTDKISVDEGSATTLETEMTTSYIVKEDMEEHLKSKEGSGEDFIELTSEELDKISHVLFTSASTAVSEEVTKQDVTTAIPSIEFTEFAKESEKSGMILDKLGGETVSTEGVIKNISTESSEEVYIGGSEESMIFTSEEASLFKVKTTEKEEFITTTISPTKIKSTTSELELCENSEDCASVANSEACDESENCDKTISKSCESEICSEEERETVEERLPSKTTKIKSVIDLSEESTIGSRYTTVANVAATMLTSQENENNSTAINVPTITDTRRSTTTSTPQHKLALKVKVLLEHINENKEKHNLVEVEKQLLLDENPQHHDNPDLLEQLKSLNDSVNMETINALLNCTSLGNLTKDTNFVKKKRSDAADSKSKELEFINSDFENSLSDQTSDYIDFRNENSEYSDSEHEVLSRRRRRRSLDEENLTKQNLYDPTDSVTDPLNISRIQKDYLMKENIQLSATTNNPEEETNNTTYTENEGNVTTAEDEITMPSTKMNISDDIDFSNVTEFHDANLTMEDIRSTTTNKPEEETSIIALEFMENENVTTERNKSTMSLIESINNDTKLEVVRESLPGIQEDVVVGLQHMVSQMAQNQLNSINKSIKEVVKTNLMDVIADPKDSRVHSRRRRATTEELGHWSNERIKEAPMGGNLRTLTEFTLYKVLP
ncbi:uncharacterized protein LOC105428465 [Pogonomyrmex barbatus]|uniref:Uncharacterized protein LOC105428465 n=1 Tax=Pogonomyrmex barbatus TaxID=144034 RepID=A0A6I9WAP9_9HYME|nr:uncharacterized protein LOC105428465 [Pogonomyrmex barbatus]